MPRRTRRRKLALGVAVGLLVAGANRPRRTPTSGHPCFACLYDGLARLAERGELGRRRDEVVGRATETVLELGSGTGENFKHYSAAANVVVAAEPDPHMRRRGRRRSAESPAPVHHVAAAGEGLPFRDSAFDTVVATLVLCSVDDPETAVAETRRVLAPGGWLLVLEHVRAGSPGSPTGRTASKSRGAPSPGAAIPTATRPRCWIATASTPPASTISSCTRASRWSPLTCRATPAHADPLHQRSHARSRMDVGPSALRPASMLPGAGSRQPLAGMLLAVGLLRTAAVSVGGLGGGRPWRGSGWERSKAPVVDVLADRRCGATFHVFADRSLPSFDRLYFYDTESFTLANTIRERRNVNMCFNRKVLLGLGAVALGVLAFAPQFFSSALPLLFVAACPLSMLLMMRGMSGGSTSCERSQGGSAPAGVDAATEIARLRDEVQRLRAEPRPRVAASDGARQGSVRA